MDKDKKKAGAIAAEDAYESEASRISDRRSALGISGEQPRWGLALSGGGIRSATFSLGVLQGLALTRRTPGRSWLEGFDYLSTVSGGGYIGSFFCSLFVPGRLTPGTDSRTAAGNAYQVLTCNPPGRAQHTIREDKSQAGSGAGGATPHIGAKPLAWLRNNGRYLAPTGAGDMFYASSLAVRNWFSLQVVIGSLIFAAFLLIALLRVGLSWCPWFADAEQEMLSAWFTGAATLWWSVLWIAPALVLGLWTIPVGYAYWLTHPAEGRSATAPLESLWTAVARANAWAILVLVCASGIALCCPQSQPSAIVLIFIAIEMAIAFVPHFQDRGDSVNARRVSLTRSFAGSLKALLAVAAIAAVDSLGQTLYAWITATDAATAAGGAATTGAAAIAIWVIRKLAKFFDDKELKGGWLARIPLNILAGIVGGALLALVTIGWQLLAEWVRWSGGAPDPDRLFDPVAAATTLAVFLVAVTLAAVMGMFPGFINQSTLQWFYSARLTRAYLGSSNGERFTGTAEDLERSASAAEPVKGDDIEHARYYAGDVLAPVHIINVTVNLTADATEQIVQRDRKGLPMAVLPTGFCVDGVHYRFRPPGREREYQSTLRIGQWIGTSGAAFTTGLGRATSLGTSLALGMANVRLGSWWDSGAAVADARKAGGWFDQALRRGFASQAYLAYEFTGQFHGLRRPWQYLSDGGHFENTAVYELLRGERKVRFIVACDDGADPDYGFGDLANLVRLARIDHETEIVVDRDVADAPYLRDVFGTPEEFRSRRPRSEKCAILLLARKQDQVLAAIVLLKPCVIEGAPADVVQYAHAHPSFPQEPTADQFFDEAQWESYRKLGLTIARRIFETHGARLAGHLLDRHGIAI